MASFGTLEPWRLHSFQAAVDRAHVGVLSTHAFLSVEGSAMTYGGQVRPGCCLAVDLVPASFSRRERHLHR